MTSSISIVLIGGIHRDPAPTSIEKRLYAHSKKENVPFVFCEEDDCDITLERAIQGNAQPIKLAERFLPIPAIQRLQQKHDLLSRPYFLFEHRQKIEEAICKECPSMRQPTLDMVVDAIQRYNHFREAIQFKQLLFKDKIPFVPIDIKDELKDGIRSEADYHAMEVARIEIMTRTILQKVVPRLGENGIAVVSTGMNHTERLAAHLALKIRKMPQKIRLFPAIVFSGYSIDGYPGHSRTVQEGRFRDSPDILKEYETLRCDRLYCSENLKSGIFQSEGLTSFVRRIFSNNQSRTERSYLTDKEWSHLSSTSRLMRTLVARRPK